MKNIKTVLFLFFISYNIGLYCQPNASKSVFQRTTIFNTNVFIENKGQFNDKIKVPEKILYALENGSDRIYFTSDGVYFSLIKVILPKLTKGEEEQLEKKGEEFAENEIKRRTKTITTLIKAEWTGANSHTQIEASGTSEGYFTYGIPDYNSKGYKKILYKEIYPGIDIEYMIPEGKGGIKYTIQVHSGADLSKVELCYKGLDVKKVVSRNSNIIIQTVAGNIIEHKPYSYDAANKYVKSSFELLGNKIKFQISESNNSQSFFIDPWVTTVSNLPITNKGYEIDYDYFGNIYISGGGQASPLVNSMVSKYDSTGVWLWTFSGVLIAPSWNADGNDISPGVIAVDKTNGKVYVSQSFKNSGTETIRLKTDGTYDNFITTPDPFLREAWCMRFHCTSNKLFCFGGSTNSARSYGFIDTINGTVTSSTIFANGGQQLDIINAAIDGDGNIFCMMASAFSSTSNNRMIKLNRSSNGYVWNVANSSGMFEECKNAPYYNAGTKNSNAYNALAVNDNFLCFNTGSMLIAFNKTSGSILPGFYFFNGYSAKQQGGIAMDDCNNIYTGGNNGNINVVNYSGSGFIAKPTITLSGFSGKKVYDVKLDKDKNLLYICGDDFVASIIPNQSCKMNTINDSISVNVNTICSTPNSAIATVITNETNPHINYIWKDSLGDVIAIHHSIFTNDTLSSGLISGQNYSLEVYLNNACGQVSDKIIFNMHSSTQTPVAHSDSIICIGDSIHLSANSLAGASYSWTGPNGFTSNIQNPFISNATVNMEGIYNVNATIGGCSSVYGTTSINISGNSPRFIYSGTSFCQTGIDPIPIFGLRDTIGVFSSSPSGLIITPASGIIDLNSSNIGTYIITNTLAPIGKCPSVSFDTTITIISPPDATFIYSNNSYCSNEANPLPYIFPGSTSGLFTSYPSGLMINASTGQINLSTSLSGTYTVYNSIAALSGCASVTGSSAFILNSSPIASISGSNQMCISDSIILYANGGGSYYWNTGETNDTINVHPTSSTSYSLVVSINNCSDTAYTNIVVHDLPIVSLDLSTIDTICSYSVPFLLSGGIPSGGYYYGSGVYSNYFYPDSVGTGIQTVNYSYTNTFGCKNIASDLIFVDQCSGISEFDNPNQIRITPNPFSDYSILNYNLKYKATVKIDVYNSVGQLLQTNNYSNLPPGNYSYKIIKNENDFQNGLYLIRITIGEKMYLEKVVNSK